MSTNSYKDHLPRNMESLSEVQQNRLRSNTFCILPWIHLQVRPDGNAYPCCTADASYPLGTLKKNTMREVWNSTDMREMRQAMLHDKPCKQCNNCYELEKTGIVSLRKSVNNEFARHLDLVNQTLPDGSLPVMNLRYWDIRFSNICNLKCRSCASSFSSRWYEDDLKLYPNNSNTTRVQFPGKHKDDLWEQIQEHITCVEQIYFAGGEPMVMEEHNKLLRLLIEKGNTQVRLFYNTNLTELRYKQESVLDLWKHFPNTVVYASLDDMGSRGELIRSGTDWKQVEQNLRELKQQCNHINFAIQPTLSVLNVWNICNFHRYMVEEKFIDPKDLQINILTNPDHYRIDILPIAIKQELQQEFLKHIEWLKSVDSYQRALNGFESAINFMMEKDNSHLIKKFWEITEKLDQIRGESTLATIPELNKISLKQAD